MTPEEVQRLQGCVEEIAEILYNNTPKDEVANLESIEKAVRAQMLDEGKTSSKRANPHYLLQRWILPQEKGITPSYSQRAFKTEEKRGKLRLIVARDDRNGAVTVHQDVDLFVTLAGISWTRC